ncbi:hypothetical protein Tco_0044487 [Tanacetum coccineum]
MIRRSCQQYTTIPSIPCSHEALISDVDAMDKELQTSWIITSWVGQQRVDDMISAALWRSAKPPPKVMTKFNEAKGICDPDQNHSEHSSDDISKLDEGNDSAWGPDNAHISNCVDNLRGFFKPFRQAKRLLHLNQNGHSPNEFPEPEHILGILLSPQRF